MLTATALAMALAATAPTRAAPGQKGDATVEFIGVYATKEAKPHCDPALLKIRKFLEGTGYNSFIAISQTSSALAVGKNATSGRLKDTYELKVGLNEVSDKTVKVTVTWVLYEKDKEGKETANPLQNYVQTMAKGKFQPFIGPLGKTGAVIVFFALR